MAAEDTEEPLLEMARAVMAISLRAADQVGEVSMVQLRALTVLGEHDPASLAQLCGRLGVTTSTGSRLVDRLVAAGLVDRSPAEHSRREIRLRLTPRGQAVLTDFDRLRMEEMTERLAALPDHHRQALHGCRDALTDAAHRLGSAPQSPASDPPPFLRPVGEDGRERAALAGRNSRPRTSSTRRRRDAPG